jgi:ABC-type transport system involved in multi-copper enzyme maturation permease subunit
MTMTSSWPILLLAGFVLALVQFLAALPWLTALMSGTVRALGRGPFLRGATTRGLAAVLAGTVLIALGLRYTADRELLTTLGRFYGAVLQVQLLFDLLVAVFGVLLAAWPRGGAVALAAFAEGVRQPMFWFLGLAGTLALFIMPVMEYFTFGEDLKMVKELGFDSIILVTGLFAVLAAGMSVSEEIEGRTAVTLMSKPVSRRQFLLGKFAGILLATVLMTGLLSLVFFLAVWYQPVYKREPIGPPEWIMNASYFLPAEGADREALTAVNAFWGGVLWWFADALALAGGLVLGQCQVMVLLAIAVALATRLPVVVNIPVCAAIHFLGHLTPVLAAVSQRRFVLVRFVAQLFDTLLPGFEDFNIGPTLARDTLPPPGPFSAYVGLVAVYAAVYTCIALLFGLILFEDRDLA